MTAGYVTPDGDNALRNDIISINDRLKELERPTGTQLFSAVAELRKLVLDLQAQVDALLAAGIVTTDVTASGTVTATTALISPGVALTDISAMSGSRSRVWIHDATGTLGFAP